MLRRQIEDRPFVKNMIGKKLKSSAPAVIAVLLVLVTIVCVTTAIRAKTHRALAREKTFTPAEIWAAYSQVFSRNLGGSEAVKAASQIMTNYPPMALIRRSQQRGDFRGVHAVGTGEGHVAMGIFFEQVIRYVYNLAPEFAQNRILLPDDLATNCFDFVDTMPQGGRELLRAALFNQFGLSIKTATKSDLMLVVANPAAPGLHEHDPSQKQKFQSRDVPMAMIADGLAQQLGVKITDETGLAGGFDYTLDLPGTPTVESITNALWRQLGLGLRPNPNGQGAEFLTVEKAR